MGDQRDPAYPPGAWVFVSHSHKDLSKVREIRDALERLGHKPLLFYLKCLEDDSAELPDLLRREIEARNVFLLCDSEHSRLSKWVQDEKEIIRAMEGKIYEEVNLEEGIDEYLRTVTRLSRRATIFLSYSVRDSDVARRIADRLRQEEYQVFDVQSIQAGGNFAAQISSAIDEAARRGFVLVLLSNSAAESRFVQQEVQYAFSIKSAVVPVIVDDAPGVFASLPDHIGFMLSRLQYFDLTGRPFEEAMTDLVRMLKKRDIE
ncbi:MAG: toll/interleukin-1 receptor domain-containing protein [Bryobacteraceae bacterium]